MTKFTLSPCGRGRDPRSGRVRGLSPRARSGDKPLTFPLLRNGSPPLPQGERRYYLRRSSDCPAYRRGGGFLACNLAISGSMLAAMKALTYIDGIWHEGNPPLLGAMSHATWLSSIVFDGARAFDGCTPDLDKHCQRVTRSARSLGLAPMLTCGEIEELARDGVRQFARGAELYIRPMFFAEEGFI